MFESCVVTVKNSTMHYLVAGKGKPIIFLHGMPTSSYLWREVIPLIAPDNLCIAPDLIGMGKSGKPDIVYSIEDHIDYLKEFIEVMGLDHFTLVVLGLGSIVGLTYANRYAEKISGIVLIEPYLTISKNLQEIPLPVQEMGLLLKDKEKLKSLIIDDNYAIEKLLPSITLAKLSENIKDIYREPFKDKNSRHVIWQFVLEQPYFNPDSVMLPLIESYVDWLKKTSFPKLLLYAMPGFLTTMRTVKWCTENFRHLSVSKIGHGLHFLPETCSGEIANSINQWLVG